MNDYMRAFVDGTPDAEGPLRFVAGTAGMKMDGRDYRMAGMDLGRYQSNPVVMWCHDIGSPPIGRGVASIDGDRLMLDVEFDMADPFAAEIDGKYRRGFLNAVSMTAIPTDGTRRGVVKTSELVEVSAVPIPLDPDALQVAGQRAMRRLGIDLLNLADLGRSTLVGESGPETTSLPEGATIVQPSAQVPPSQGEAATSEVLDAIAGLAARLDALEGSQEVDPADTANDLDALSALAATLPPPKEGTNNG